MNSSNSLTEELLGQLKGAPLQKIAQQLGLGSAETEQAVNTALPMLLGALGANAANSQGAQELFGALQRDHQTVGNGLGDMLGGLLGVGQAQAADGASILDHIFGSKQPQAETALAQASGANGGQLLQILAPIVMAFLAQRVQSGGLDASGLGQELGDEKAQLQQQGGAIGSLLTGLLDQNRDGKLDMGDLFKLGTSLLGGRR